MAPKKTDRNQILKDLRRELIASRLECAQLRRERDEIRAASIAAIEALQKQKRESDGQV